ncbi:MAG: HEAT repeat domain-containing protein [Bacteroidetes bacterium]|nr:HEAT repeat domain-containing protein [Bacteroidota bacterium]
MKIILLKIIFILNALLNMFPGNTCLSQSIQNSVLTFTLEARGLTENDITIPLNFDKDKSPTNNAKLILPEVKYLMKVPLGSFGFMDSVSDMSNKDLMDILKELSILGNFNSAGKEYPDIILSGDPGQFETFILRFCKEKKSSSLKMLSEFSKDELKFLSGNLMSVIAESENEDNNNSDIFRFNKARDSSIAVSKRTLDILSKEIVSDNIKEHITDAGTVYQIYKFLSASRISFSEEEFISNEYVNGNFYFYYDKDGIRIAIGGKGRNTYTGKFNFIIDTGGDDVYDIANNAEKELFKNNFSCIIDLAGNDYYASYSNYSLAGSVFSSGFIFDKEGDDTYKGKNVSLGSAICGLGVLYDESGNDTYQANQFSIGAASFGIGLLLDKNGNDVYIANSYAQGFGMTEGVGAIADNKGNDNYLIDARSLDIGRYEDHYVSMSQGYGLGLRPYYAGGIGLIIEGEGNDFYSTDIFGQGGAYWYGLGCIADRSGNDKYNSYQYAQGAGIHLAVGLLKDYEGWDFYTSDGVSQGCGHDFGFGLLYDVKGNDNYSAYSLSQGAGNANGIGILFDESGRDGYLNKEPGNTRGYGNSRREYGSLGIFLDASGDDFYSAGGMDSVISNSSMWGVMNDYFLKDNSSVPSGTNYKVPLDSNRNYTSEDYFTMAKTIEPRFSLWQEYGFRKLAEDSITTSEYILKFLDTEDHRAGLVLRNLAFKIGYTMGNVFVDRLRKHLYSMNARPVFNENQLAYICYLFGETGNPAGREELLMLTEDENIRVRSAAVNALGKLKTDSSDSQFIIKASQRLRELAEEKSAYKMFNKDIAFALRKYKSAANIPVLIQLMNYDYFGVRFIASEDLKDYGNEYVKFLDENTFANISSEKKWSQAFLYSIINIDENEFRELFRRISDTDLSEDESIKINIINLLKIKKDKSLNNEFRSWAEEIISESESKINLKVK